MTCKSWGSATSEDGIKLTEIALSREVDCVIHHFATNDLTKLSVKRKDNNGKKLPIETLKELEHAAKLAKDAKTELVVSLPLDRWDEAGIDRKVEALRKSMKDFCNSKNIRTIEHKIDPKFFSSGKVHLTTRGSAVLAKSFLNFLDNY